MKVLIVGNDNNVNKDVLMCLPMRYTNIIFTTVNQGEKGIELIETETPDLVLLTSTLPDMERIEFIKAVRDFSDVMLIAFTDVDSGVDRARGLEAGVDEYIVKPVNCIEFMAIVNALLRRTKGAGQKQEGTLVINEWLTINLSTHEVFTPNKQIHLTPTEYKVLIELARNSGRTISHNSILEKVWGIEYANDLKYLKKYIYRLRCKIEPKPQQPSILLTDRGFGYKMVKTA